MPSSSASFTIKGDKELIRKLGVLAAGQVYVNPIRESLTDDIRPEAQIYPPERPNQRYVRTYRLQKGWERPPTVRVSGGDVTGSLANRVPYGPWVQGWDTQAWMHRNRWSTNQGILRKLKGRVVARIQRAIDKALR